MKHKKKAIWVSHPCKESFELVLRMTHIFCTVAQHVSWQKWVILVSIFTLQLTWNNFGRKEIRVICWSFNIDTLPSEQSCIHSCIVSLEYKTDVETWKHANFSFYFISKIISLNNDFLIEKQFYCVSIHQDILIYCSWNNFINSSYATC